MCKVRLLLDSMWLQTARQEGRGSRRHVIGGLLGRFAENFGEGRRCSGLEEGTGSGVVRSLLAPGSEEDNGSRALTSDRLPSPRPVQPHSGTAGRVRAVLSSRKKKKTAARLQNLPSAVWKKFFI
ncbi:hypothetical protein VZT92_007260 [Zoarces viviparus]|uniref:Uncharacterized protein n=1 Tax=Zoarces viviparus TaxID=48416 RepID=A0AAW1FKU0_ZOAVI